MQFMSVLCIAICSVLAIVTPVAAQSTTGSTAASEPTGLSLAQRSAIANDLIAKWQGDVKRTPKGSVKGWSTKLTKVIATADAANVLRATTMTSLDMMHAALNGYMPTAPVVSSTSLNNGGVTPQLLGSPTADTTYTPLPFGRCRVADSRVINSPLVANVERVIDSEDNVNYSAQGGSGTYANGNGAFNCGLPSFVTALAVSVTLLSPTASGVFKLYENGKPYQVANSILYNAGTFGANGDLIITSCRTCNEELAIRASSPVHYVLDIIGYFMPPQKTPLSCYETTTPYQNLIPNGTATATASLCDAGYAQMSTNCETNNENAVLRYIKDGFCSARNFGTGSGIVSASRTCCQVPGR